MPEIRKSSSSSSVTTTTGGTLSYGYGAPTSIATTPKDKLRQQGCLVYYEKSITKNLGNFNSAKVTVGGYFPVNPTKDELEAIKESWDIVAEAIDEELVYQVDQLREED